MYVFVCTCVCVSKLLPNHCSAISPHFRGGNSPLFMLSLSFLCNAFHSAPKLTKLKTRPKSCNWKHDVCDSLSQFVFWFCFFAVLYIKQPHRLISLKWIILIIWFQSFVLQVNISCWCLCRCFFATFHPPKRCCRPSGTGFYSVLWRPDVWWQTLTS